MTAEPDIRAIVAEAKRKGYFSTDDFSGLRFSQQEMLELIALLNKKGIAFGRPEPEETPIDRLAEKEAKMTIVALRKGVPPIEGTHCYSVGRHELLDGVARDLTTAASRKSLVRFLNADIGQGKTHALYRLRELAFDRGFAVSVVTLSQNSCPLYDFMAVYREIMWGLRTADQRRKPALSNIIDRWVEDIRAYDKARIREIVCHELPASLCEIMGAYAATTNMFRPDEKKRQLIIKYLGGEKVRIREVGIGFRLNSGNALQILSEMATTIRYIGFRGICILFDEAEAIHSFARSSQRDQAYANLRQIISQSRGFRHCYFIYATTPSFFESYAGQWPNAILGSAGILELEPLGSEERQEIGVKIAKIYARATGWETSPKVLEVIQGVATVTAEMRIGDYIRQVVGVLDETRAQA